MKNYKKIISLALTLAMILSAVFCTGVVANAEDTAPTTNGVTKVTFSTTEADMDWSLVGPNLIPDSTVSEFDKDGNYKKYYTAENWNTVYANSIANPNAWWARAANGSYGYNANLAEYKGVGITANGVTLDESHTKDGTGAIVHDYSSSSLEKRRLAMNGDVGAYYLLSFWSKTTDGNGFNIHFQTGSGSASIKDAVWVTTGTEWTHATYIVSAATIGFGALVVQSNTADRKIYIDEVELYKLDGKYAQDCIAAGKLLTGNDEYYANNISNGFTEVYSSGNDYNDIDFSTFGTNLFSDPTVKEFDANGSYKSSGVFAKNTFANAWTMNSKGAILNDPALSRTNDGSGVLKLTNAGQHLINLPTLEAKSAYLITFWVKDSSAADAASDYDIYVYNHANGKTYVPTVYNAGKYENSGDWHRVSFICHRAGTSNPNVDIVIKMDAADAPLYADDVAIYKLDAKYAISCIEKAELLPTDGHAKDDSDDSEEVVIETNDYKDIYSTGQQYNDIDFSTFGTNLFSDPTVNEFENGVYKSTGIFAKNVYEYSWTMVGRGATLYEPTLSRTNDNSGVLKLTNAGEHLIDLPNLEARSAYLVTFWVKDSSAADAATSDYDIGFYNFYNGKTYGPTVYNASNFKNRGKWHRVSYICSRAASSIDNIGILITLDDTDAPLYVDDFAVYKLDTKYALESMAEGKLINNTEAEKKDPVSLTVETAKSTVDATVADGYFVPYGAFATQDGKMAEKLGNGRFYVENAGTYAYTQFKYPANVVGTFGASAKATGEQTGIQFGSLITDNLSVAEGGAGTLVFRGEFYDFCKTFPTKTTKEVVEDIYAKLKAYEAVNGSVANKGVRLSNEGVSVVVMYVPQTKYMWRNDEQTQLQ